MVYAGSLDPQVDAIEKALADPTKDNSYPAWSDHYVRDVVAKQSSEYGSRVSDIIAESVPAKLVNNPQFDFGTQEAGINLIDVLSKEDAQARAKLDKAIAELLANFGAHTRNEIRSILKASNQQ
jgi:hypothetical protein